jgi:phosphoribosylcarboxyaminoimidazole (NCAIR) mutase
LSQGVAGLGAPSQRLPALGATQTETKTIDFLTKTGPSTSEDMPSTKAIDFLTKTGPSTSEDMPSTKRFNIVKPMGLTLEDVSSGNGAKIAEIDPFGNAAKIDGMVSAMRLTSVNGVPCKDAPYDGIMQMLRGLDPSAPVELEMEVNAPAAAVDAASRPTGVKVRVESRKELGGASAALFQANITLQPEMCRALRWKQARSIEGRPIMMVEQVAEGSDAYRLGIRPGMVVKAMAGGTGRTQQERFDMTKLRAINKRNFMDNMRLARYPIDFEMLEGVKLGTEADMTMADRRIATAYKRRKEIEQIDEQKVGYEGRDFPLVGFLVGATMLPPIVILALNFAFGWETGGGALRH